jgi:negative regulator of flagellin synthesis FlgM
MMITPGNESGSVRNNDIGSSRVHARPQAANPAGTHKLADSAAHEPVSLSVQARNMLKLEQDIRSQTEVRDKKVVELRNLIDSGQYSINPQKIADSMLKNDEWF